MSKPQRYTDAAEVLPPDVLFACQQAIGFNRLVMCVRPPSGGGLTSGEELLGKELASAVRSYLDTYMANNSGVRRRALMFRGSRRRTVLPQRRQQARHLVEVCGFTAQATADALGVARETVSRWTKVGGRSGAVILHDGDALARGLRHMMGRRGLVITEDPQDNVNRLALVLSIDRQTAVRRAHEAGHALAALATSDS